MDRILLATDGSDVAGMATDRALELAEAFGARLHVLHVDDVAHRLSPYAESKWDEMLEAVETEGRDAATAVAERAKAADIPVRVAVRPASVVHREILDYADTHDIDTIVVGTHGRSGLERWMLGSVAERLLRASDRPVLVVPPEAEGTG